jgi:HlyD family secretion protein
MKRFSILLILLAAVIGIGFLFWNRTGTSSTVFKFASVSRGDLLITISATGTLEPIEVIDVGAQIAGKIEYFGKDPMRPDKTVDYGTQVEQGTVLAKIDDSIYSAAVDQAMAQVEQAKANVLRARADLLQSKAKLRQAESNWKRAQELGPSRALSATDYDSYKATYETAQATVEVSQASLVQAEKSVMQSQAALKQSQTNLGYCTIKSPVKGVIIDRRVNIGQTVVASLNAPSLFLIAKDLTKMQVWASVNEADIGNIHPGQKVTFTVDAHPGQTFYGEVGKIRLNASMTQNVVTYTVEINTDNSDGKLLPYLTANVKFEVAQRQNVLLVPNAALRWVPTNEQLSPEAKNDQTAAKPTNRFASQPATKPSIDTSHRPLKQGVIWLQADTSFAQSKPVDVYMSDGSMTEIGGEGIQEGMKVIVGEIEPNAQDDNAPSPFTPQFRAGSKR